MLDELLPADPVSHGAPEPGQSWRGTIAADPTERGVEVVVPGYDRDYRFGPCPYVGQGSSVRPAPARGARCLVAFDDDADPHVVWWDGMDTDAATMTEGRAAGGDLAGRWPAPSVVTIGGRAPALADDLARLRDTVGGSVVIWPMPSSPRDGQVVWYMADSGGGFGGPYFWPLRYVAATGWWVPVGRPEALYHYPTTNFAATTASTAYTETVLAAGPEVVLPFAGVWGVEWSATVRVVEVPAAWPEDLRIYPSGLDRPWVGASHAFPALWQLRAYAAHGRVVANTSGSVVRLVTASSVAARVSLHVFDARLSLWPIRIRT